MSGGGGPRPQLGSVFVARRRRLEAGTVARRPQPEVSAAAGAGA